jgi:hypothetical protein
MNCCLAKWVVPCLAPLFRLLGGVYRAIAWQWATPLLRLSGVMSQYNSFITSIDDGLPSQSDISSVKNWCTANQRKLNADETNAISFSITTNVLIFKCVLCNCYILRT